MRIRPANHDDRDIRIGMFDRHWFWRHVPSIAFAGTVHYWPGQIGLRIARGRTIRWLAAHLWPRWWAWNTCSTVATVPSWRWLLGPAADSDWHQLVVAVVYLALSAAATVATWTLLSRHDGFALVPLFGAVTAIFGTFVSFYAWRTTWDSSTPPTSKSSPPSLSRSNFRTRIVSWSPPASPSASPSPLNAAQFAQVMIQRNVAQWDRADFALPLPTVTVDQPVVGFRFWLIAPHQGHDENGAPKAFGTAAHPLLPQHYEWPAWKSKGVTKAACCALMINDRPVPAHDAPDRTCNQCGLYAKNALPEVELPSINGRVYGAVLAWGRLLRHPSEKSNGFRAQYARPLALAIPDRQTTIPSLIFSGACAVLMRTPGTPGELLNHYRAWPTETACARCGIVYWRRLTDQEWAKDLSQLERIATTVGVPLIPAASIERYAGEFGTNIKHLQAKENA